jgi:serine/threonine-protein kinase TTK/MPS1
MPQKKQLCMVMELGSTDLNAFFKKEIQKYGCVKEPTRTYYWMKMLEAVHAIHMHGIVHSDIKPSNFLVVGCEVKLIDFNISNNLSDKTSITTVCDCGTLNYMAPESLMKNNESKTKVCHLSL